MQQVRKRRCKSVGSHTRTLYTPPPTPTPTLVAPPSGTLQVGLPRDKMLSSLCEFALMAPPEDGQPGALVQEGLLVSRSPPPGPGTGAGGSGGGGGSGGAGAAGGVLPPPSPALLYTLYCPQDILLGRLSGRNVAVLRALLLLVGRLAPVLGPAWLHVIDALNCLDRLLTSPYTVSEHDQVRGEAGSCRDCSRKGHAQLQSAFRHFSVWLGAGERGWEGQGAADVALHRLAAE